MRNQKFYQDNIVYVTGYWMRPDEITLDEKVMKALHETCKSLAGSKMIAFYHDLEVIDFFRQEAFDFDIQFIGARLSPEELPAWKYIEDFMRRTRAFGVAQHPDKPTFDHLDKAWCLYWTIYLRFGEAAYRQYLSAKLSKVEITGKIAPEVSSFGATQFAWVDYDFTKWTRGAEGVFGSMIDYTAQDLRHFGGQYSYLGRRLPISSHHMVGSIQTWSSIVDIYNQEIERLGQFPYAYDEEIALSLAKSQHPEQFALFGELKETQQIRKTGTESSSVSEFG